MRNDFESVHLKEANRRLDSHVLYSLRHEKHDDTHKDENVQSSLWKKFLGVLKTNPFVLPEDLYKYK